MSDWKHENGYEEPEECDFCVHCRADMPGESLACWNGYKGTRIPTDPCRKAWAYERQCSARGTCRKFTRRQS